MSDGEYETSASGAAETIPMQASALRKGGFALLKGAPCKIVEMSTSKTGKHGHAKINMTGIGIFDGKKYEDMTPSTHNMSVPNVKRTEYTVLDMDDEGFLTLMSEDGSETRDDLRYEPTKDMVSLEDLKTELEAMEKEEGGDMNYFATVTKAMGKEKILDMKKKKTKD